MKMKLIAGLALGVLMLGSVAWAENEAVYDFSTGALNIPKVAVGSDYYHVDMQQLQGPDIAFRVTSAPPSTSGSSANIATYNSGSLNIPTVIVGADRYTVDMVLTGGLDFVVTNATPVNSTPSTTATVMWQGKEWQQSGSASTMTWDDANSYCAALNEGGHDDWTLPTIEELVNLIVCSNGTQVTYTPGDSSGAWCGDVNSDFQPTINSSFTSSTSFYWSSTSYTGDPASAWGVNFFLGMVDGNSKTGSSNYARCVRSGQ